MTQRARKRLRRSRRSAVKRILIGFGFVFFVVLVAAVGAVMWFLHIWDSTPSIASLKPIRQGSNSVVFAADGSRLGYVQSDTLRHPVHGSKIPSDLKNATVAIEDKNFYHHGGVDYGSIIRAGWADLKAGAPVQGGSTITQQLVRNLYIAHPQEDIERKIHEANLAEQYENKYTKDQILDKYLNTASYGTTDGRTAVGVQAASQTYFSKSVSKLNLPEAALIAGLPQAPSEYNPFLNPRAALGRRNEVLQAMLEQGYISQGEYDQASRAGIGLNRGHKYQSIREPYFFDYVTQQLIDRYGVNTFRNGGLKVYTTINPQLQADAQRAVDSCAVCYSGGGPAAALASLDPRNGHILAMASSQPYSAGSQFNFAANAHRQPGSSFKPYVLATALSQGMNPDTTYYSGRSPMTLTLDDGTTWTVNNAERAGAGTLSVKQATIESVNVVFAQLDLDVGPESVRQMAYKLGITTHLDGIPAEGIGGLRIGVTPLEQADAYGTFADGGIHHPATAISRVVFPNGKTDVPDQGQSTRPISDGLAYEVTSILKGVITQGTGAGYTDFGCPAAGKTGTTEGESDAWFVGYTPQLAAAVWVGHPTSRATTGFGGPTAGPIWRAYMESAHGSFCGDFPQPQTPMQFSSSWSGAHAVSSRSSSSSYSSGGGTGTGTYQYQPPAPPPGSTTTQYPPQYYAPGAGQGPVPSPGATGNGNSGGGGPPGGVPPGQAGGTGGSP
jgi:penicillin-binding protein 1A